MGRRSSALPEKIAQDLMERILKDEFAGTNILPSERVLQDSYGVSRTVIREALKLLAARGLITTGTGQGAIIGQNLTAPAIDALLLAFHRTQARIEDVLNTRIMIEPEIARLAAQYATPLQIRRLYDLSVAMAELAQVTQVEQAAQRSNDINAQFHTTLAQASQNPVLEILISILVGIVWRQQSTVDLERPLNQYIETAAEHREIVRAVEQRDADRAHRLMYEHLDITRKGLQSTPGNLSRLIQTLYTNGQ
jgi:GntR family transcriptional repressor for pyruvate dehydrogenase complex